MSFSYIFISDYASKLRCSIVWNTEHGTVCLCGLYYIPVMHFGCRDESVGLIMPGCE